MTETINTHYRACHLCEAICGLEIKTQGDQILSIKGDKDDPFSRGHICPKATAIEDVHNDPDRLKLPVKRVGDTWETISWDEAFQLVADNVVKLQQAHGDNSIGVYAGNPNVHHYGSLTHGRVLRNALRTRNNFSATSLDQLPHHLIGHALYGHQFLLPVPDIDHTQFMLILGANPMASNGSMMTVPDIKKRLTAIQQRGGRFVVVDPRRSETAELADAHHFIKPGTDAFLLMAMLHTLFAENLIDTGAMSALLDGVDAVRDAAQPFTPERAAEQTGMAADTIRQLARDMAQAESAVCYGRMGVSVQQFGSLCQWAINAINILTGNLDREGGALFCSSAVGYVHPGEPGKGHFGKWKSRVRGLPEFGGELPSATLAEEMLTEGEGQIRGLFTLAGNPVISAPNGRQLEQALEQLDFMVAIDIYINETTRHADVILPPTSALEHDHYDYAFLRLAVRDTTRYNEPVFAPAEGALHDWQILNGLAAKIGELKGEKVQQLPPPHMIIDMALQHGPYGKAKGHERALDLATLKAHPHGIDLGPLKPSLPERICTDNKRVNLAVDFILEDAQRLHASQVQLADDELLLIGRRHVRSNNSWMHNSRRLVKGKTRSHMLMHPDDMAKHGVADGAHVTVTSRVGEVTTEVRASDEVMPGVVSIPHGFGHQRKGVKLGIATEVEGVSVNDLTDDQYCDPVTGNAALNGVPVRVRAA